MKSIKILIGIVVVVLFLFAGSLSFASLSGQIGHDCYIYPVVRVSDAGGSGSGTVLYSKINEDKEFSTYVLTNYHVISGAIKVVEKFDNDLGKDVKQEKKSICHVEIFKYRDLSTPIGTLKVEADIVIHNQEQDMALLKLRSTEEIKKVAQLLPIEQVNDIKCLDETVAVGCSLAFPPLPTTGILTRKNFQIDSLPYYMSSAQIIYGNSGGAMFDGQGNFIGIPSMVAIVGWGTPVTHMGLFIPVSRVYDWLEDEYYDFIFNIAKTEKQCLEDREKEIEKKKESRE